MNLQTIKDRIKKHEGYRDMVYEDHLGFKTIGYGHLVVEDGFIPGIQYSKKEFLQDSNKCSVFLCNPGEIYGQWIHIDKYVKLKELIRKYKSNLQEVTYQRDEDYARDGQDYESLAYRHYA